jgi:hypothetical protein
MPMMGESMEMTMMMYNFGSCVGSSQSTVYFPIMVFGTSMASMSMAENECTRACIPAMYFWPSTEMKPHLGKSRKLMNVWINAGRG